MSLNASWSDLGYVSFESVHLKLRDRNLGKPLLFSLLHRRSSLLLLPFHKPSSLFLTSSSLFRIFLSLSMISSGLLHSSSSIFLNSSSFLFSSPVSLFLLSSSKFLPLLLFASAPVFLASVSKQLMSLPHHSVSFQQLLPNLPLPNPLHIPVSSPPLIFHNSLSSRSNFAILAFIPQRLLSLLHTYVNFRQLIQKLRSGGTQLLGLLYGVTTKHSQ